MRPLRLASAEPEEKSRFVYGNQKVELKMKLVAWCGGIPTDSDNLI